MKRLTLHRLASALGIAKKFAFNVVINYVLPREEAYL